MKKSLIIRWVIIAIVILVWTLAMFPIKDKDYMSIFRKLSAKTVAELQAKGAEFEKANGNPADIIKKLGQATDKNSQEYKDLAEKLETLRKAENFDAWRKAEDFKELEKRLDLIDKKSTYESAVAIKAEMDAIQNKELPEYKDYEAAYNAIVSNAEYKKWTETDEYKELLRRLPVEKLKQEIELIQDKTSEAYRTKLADYNKQAEALDKLPEFDTPEKKADYEEIVKHLSLIYDVDRSISAFKKIEKAANGNSSLYRIYLNDFVKVPFHPNCSNKVVLRYIRHNAAGKLRLGLDLRGGTEFVLDFNMDEANGLIVTEKTMQAFIVNVLSDGQKYSQELPKELNDSIVAFKEANKNLDAQDTARAMLKNAELAGNIREFLAKNSKYIPKHDMTGYGDVKDIRDRILSIMDNRLNSMGVTEPEIKASGENTISVRMPSVDEADKNEIRNTIRKAAKLEFYLVAENNNELVQAYENDRQGFVTPAGVIRTEIENERSNGQIDYQTIFLEAQPTPVKGEDIERAFATSDELGRWVISLKFNSEGTIAFRDVTSKNVGRFLAIVLDNKVYSAPRLKTAIDNGAAIIEGTFTLEEAKRLASVIASGNVPVTINIGSEFGTDPTLGRDSIQTGTYAGILGLIVVVLFMLWYYRFAGFVAVCALTVNTILVFGTMAITHATITMPGISGMILTIGMAVDANVIIFERIREEIIAKASITNAIKAGYARAFSSIFDSNLTTLLTAFALYVCGSGSIKGFAVTLGFGILASMFTAIFMTRAIFDIFIFKDIIKSLNMVTIKKLYDIKFDFMGAKKAALGIAIALVVFCLLTFAVKGRGMMGIDFTGGTELSYECHGQAPNVEQIREFLKTKNYSDNVRVGYKRGQSGERLLEIVLPIVKEDGMEKAIDYTDFNRQLDEKFPEVKISLKQTNTVGANVGSQFKSAAFWAAFWAVVGIIVYLAFRFEFMYGVAATIAIIHDAIVSCGLYVLLGGTVSLTVVAAIMTIMGYSLNDTIVIFDRVRETKNTRKDLTYTQIINKAIGDCMSRTIMTSLTTMLVVISLLVFGGGAVRDFALVMFFGVISGTYSSIFLSNAIINTWHKRSLASEKAEAKANANSKKEAVAKA